MKSQNTEFTARLENIICETLRKLIIIVTFDIFQDLIVMKDAFDILLPKVSLHCDDSNLDT